MIFRPDLHKPNHRLNNGKGQCLEDVLDEYGNIHRCGAVVPGKNEAALCSGGQGCAALTHYHGCLKDHGNCNRPHLYHGPSGPELSPPSIDEIRQAMSCIGCVEHPLYECPEHGHQDAIYEAIRDLWATRRPSADEAWAQGFDAGITWTKGEPDGSLGEVPVNPYAREEA